MTNESMINLLVG